jgi:hypothetical protein
MVFPVGAAPRFYNEDLRQLRGELMESLETAVEEDREEMARKELGCEKKTYVFCSYSEAGIVSVEIRCLDTTSED